MKSIISFGSVYLDINALHFPIPEDVNILLDTETVGPEYKMELGGSALNFSRFCTKLGLSAQFIGKTGEDFACEILKKLFLQEGIVPLMHTSSDVQTNLNTNLVSDNNTSLMLTFGNANQSLAIDDINQQVRNHISDIDAVYLGGVFKLKNILTSLPGLITFLKKNNKKIIIDHGRIVNTVTEEMKQTVRNIVKSADIYLPSKDEFLELWQANTIDEGLNTFSSLPVLVVVKDAENGCYSIQDKKIIHMPGFAVNAYNTVGAGDAFNAGFIKTQIDNLSIVESMRFANATAALKISQQNFPAIEQIQSLL